ncbi:MAG: hypothetical protein E7653_04855 [Ruminococcaceae bacterium]|nr:hypothetical protein [Oscillospiraceae bacterium]
MRKIRIVSDSSSDILTLEHVDFAFSPMKIVTADREIVDNAALNVDEMADYFNGYYAEKGGMLVGFEKI